jgi:hypothetical protein
METAAMLLEAKERLLSKGWHKGTWAMREKRYTAATDPLADSFCLVGAIRACGKPFDMRKAFSSLYEVIFGKEEVPEEVVVYLSNWNDTPSRTKKEVIDALDKTLSRIQSRGL